MIYKLAFLYCVINACILSVLAIGFHFFGFNPFKGEFNDLYGAIVTHLIWPMLFMSAWFYFVLNSNKADSTKGYRGEQ